MHGVERCIEQIFVCEVTFLTTHIMNVWTPYRCKNQAWGPPHPGSVMEATALANVEAPPNDYPILETLGEQVKKGKLSSMQIEGIAYACMRHQQFLPNGMRAGFLVADSTGIGKGRQMAGIILESLLRGRNRHFWISSSMELFEDASRDFRAIGCTVKLVDSLTTLKKMASVPEACVLFTTYTELAREGKKDELIEFLCKGDVENYDGVMVLDECHRAKGYEDTTAGGSKSGQMAVELQTILPRGRVVYSSATAIDDVAHMSYMIRMGLWGTGTSFSNFKSFRKVGGEGTTVMETLAIQLKNTGCQVARNLGFEGTEYQPLNIDVDVDGQKMYARSARLWHDVLVNLREATRICAEYQWRANRGDSKTYWSCNQRFFRQLLTCIKIPALVDAVKKELAEGRCVVIGIQDTGESSVDRAIEQGQCVKTEFGWEGSRPVSVCREILRNFVQEHFPVRAADETFAFAGKYRVEAQMEDYYEMAYMMDLVSRRWKVSASCLQTYVRDAMLPPLTKTIKEIRTAIWRHSRRVKWCVARKRDLMWRIDKMDFPMCALDDLMHRLGGHTYVSELTGRTKRQEIHQNGVRVVTRASQSKKRSSEDSGTLNGRERRAFMDGDKLIAIISDAASTGISLHAEAEVRNQRRRVHFTLELAWSANQVLQQMGRTNRSNQTSAPIYRMVTTTLGGERRFSFIVSRRLKMLGAITHGDSRASSASMTGMNVEDEYACPALDLLLQSIRSGRFPEDVDIKSAFRRAGPMLRVSPDPKADEKRRWARVRHSKGCQLHICTPICSSIKAKIRHGAVCAHGPECPDMGEYAPMIRHVCEKCEVCDPKLEWCPTPNTWSTYMLMETLDELVKMMSTSMADVNAREAVLSLLDTPSTADDVNRFFNRVLSMPTPHQTLVYEVFMSCIATVRSRLVLRKPTFGRDVLVREGEPLNMARDMGTGGFVTMHTIRSNRGCTFEEMYRELRWRQRAMSDPDAPVVAEARSTPESFSEMMTAFGPRVRFMTDGIHVWCVIEQNDRWKSSVRASTCRDQHREWRDNINRQHTTDYDLIKCLWDKEYVETAEKCIHGDDCKCELGKRVGTFCVITGCVISMWDRLQSGVNAFRNAKIEWNMSLEAFTLADGTRLVGVAWPAEHVEHLRRVVDEWREDVRTVGRRLEIDVVPRAQVVIPPTLTSAKSEEERKTIREQRKLHNEWLIDSGVADQMKFMGFATDNNCVVTRCSESLLERGVRIGQKITSLADRAFGFESFPTSYKRLLVVYFKSRHRVRGMRAVFMREPTPEEVVEETRFEREGLRRELPAPIRENASEFVCLDASEKRICA